MLVELTISSILDILTCCSAFMLGLLFIFSVSENKRANIYLGIFLLSISVEVLDVLSESMVSFTFIVPQTTLFTIPFLLLYILQTINFRIKPLHFILLLPGIFINGAFYFSIESMLFGILEYIYNITILLSILSILNSHKVRLDNFYSDLENKTLQWMKIIVYMFLGFHVLWIIEDIIGLSYENIGEYFAMVSTIATFFMVLWIGHNGFSQHEIFKRKLFALKQNSNESENTDNLRLSVSIKKEEEIFEKLCKKIADEKLFAESKLNLRTLSEALGLNEKELSRLINQQTNSNFYRFINHFRVDEFKTLMHSSKAQHFSILGLAEEAGFNSKSTFYAAFKTIEGITPKEYENSLK